MMREAEKFSVSLSHFDTVPTGWLGNISKRPNNCVDFLLQRQSALKKS
jgi:hypothetical protein